MGIIINSPFSFFYICYISNNAPRTLLGKNLGKFQKILLTLFPNVVFYKWI